MPHANIKSWETPQERAVHAAVFDILEKEIYHGNVPKKEEFNPEIGSNIMKAIGIFKERHPELAEVANRLVAKSVNEPRGPQPEDMGRTPAEKAILIGVYNILGHEIYPNQTPRFDAAFRQNTVKAFALYKQRHPDKRALAEQIERRDFNLGQFSQPQQQWGGHRIVSSWLNYNVNPSVLHGFSASRKRRGLYG